MIAPVRVAVAAIGVAFAAWVGIGIYRAGEEVPPPASDAQTKLTAGHAEGRRIDGKPSWSLDYDRLVTSPDTSVATLENVRHGELFKRGKPFMQIVAKHVVINTLSNDFVVTGPLELTENDGQHKRHIVSVDATYTGAQQTLSLHNPATIDADGARVKVRTAEINFRSGDMSLGSMTGLY
jgi:hypothetical protein